MMLRTKKKTNKDISLYDPIGTDKEGNEISLLDVIEEPNLDVVDQMVLTDNISKLYELVQHTLTKREKEIIVLRYGLLGYPEVTQREIGKRLGISRSYVSRIEKKALEKLRVEFEKNGK